MHESRNEIAATCPTINRCRGGELYLVNHLSSMLIEQRILYIQDTVPV
jgi:hypothetical protein